MKQYAEMTKAERKAEYARMEKQYRAFQEQHMSLNMARGLPCEAQLQLVMPILDALNGRSRCIDKSGVDCRNFGELKGISEARELFGAYMEVTPEETFVAGSSSLNFMYQCLAAAMISGVRGSEKPWKDYGKIKFLCPVPGYDRHFAMCEYLGIDMINVPLREDGPDMDLVEKLAGEDETVKGIWCNPKFSNPLGVVYSDETVRRLAGMKTAAEDFRIFWDNSYAYHYVYQDVKLLNLLTACKEAGNPDRAYMFGSTSKITIPGAGVAFMAASRENIDFVAKQMAPQSISWDKMNMLRHVRFLKDMDHIRALMDRHAAILRPHFDALLAGLESGLAGTGVGEWMKPNGGYFVTFKGPRGTARRIVRLCADAGVKVTAAGATHPYHRDPEDAYIRLAPSFPDVDVIRKAMELFTIAARLASLEAMDAEPAEQA